MYSESFLNCLKHYGTTIGTANSVGHKWHSDRASHH
jgi:hypothetical protein